MLVPVGEIYSKRADIRYGTFRAGIKFSGVNGTCGAFFWYCTYMPQLYTGQCMQLAKKYKIVNAKTARSKRYSRDRRRVPLLASYRQQLRCELRPSIP